MSNPTLWIRRTQISCESSYGLLLLAVLALSIAQLICFPRASLLKTLSTYTKEHYPSSTYSVYPTSSDSELTIVVVANRYSPSNFWYFPPSLFQLGSSHFLFFSGSKIDFLAIPGTAGGGQHTCIPLLRLPSPAR